MSQFFNPFEGANGGGGGGGTSDYSELSNKPKINSVTLTGNKSLEDLGIVNTVVDSELSTTSENPVQNKIVTSAINEKLDIDDAVGKNTTGTEYTIDGQTVVAQAGAEIFNDYAHNQAAGRYSHAEGEGSKALGVNSHAEGSYTQAIGTQSHSEGASTKATGAVSHAEGSGTIASGISSHAEGGGTTASGESAHAEGNSTTASGDYSHAENSNTIASGPYSHAEGRHTIAAGVSQHVQGKFNAQDTNSKYAFIIGNGTSNVDRHNAFAVDWDGKVYVNGAADGVDVSKGAGKNVTGTEYTIGGRTVVAGYGAEIFNDYANNKAAGYYSHAEGGNVTASGHSAHAEGNSTAASGDYSHAEGNDTAASGIYSHSEGHSTTASKSCSHAEGENTTASGTYSHAEGWGTTASGSISHAEGGSTQATGTQSHAEGDSTKATGATSHAEGVHTTASGPYTHAEGNYTTASGPVSHAEGDNTIASGNYSHAEGEGTISAGNNQHAQGKYNIQDANNKYAFIIGNGTASNNRSNAFAVDWNGKVYINNAADGVDISKYAGKNVAGTEYMINGQTVVAQAGAEIFNTGKAEIQGQVFENDNKATGLFSHAEGVNTKAVGSPSHAEGYNTFAEGNMSHAEGEGTIASGVRSHAEGYNTTASGDMSHAEGQSTTATSMTSHAEGDHTESTGSASHAEGYYTQATALNSHAEGNHTIAAAESQHVQGKFNIAQGDLNTQMAFIIGNGTSSQNRSNAFAIDWNGNIYQNNSNVGINLNELKNAEQQDREALIEQINKGAKNLLKVGFADITDGSLTVTKTADGNGFIVNGTRTETTAATLVADIANGNARMLRTRAKIPAGRYYISGTNDAKLQIQVYAHNGTARQLLIATTSGGIFEYTAQQAIDYPYIVFCLATEGDASYDNLTIYPMCCSEIDYNMSQQFEPYSLTNRELCELVTPLINDVKNKIKLGFTSITSHGITISQTADGCLILNGTLSTSVATIIIYDLYDGNTTTSISGNRKSLQSGNSYIVKGTDNENVMIQLVGYNSGDSDVSLISNSTIDLTIASLPQYDYYAFRLQVAGDASFDNFKICPMCCSVKDYNFNTDHVPYAKTNRELTVTEQEIMDILNPMTQAEYDALTTKTLPLYFVYEE